jgi:hypothetical protein
MKTAVEFLLEKYKSQNTLLFAEDFERAKEMEKEQIEDAYHEGSTDAHNCIYSIKSFEKYYNKTFKSE